MKLVLNCATFSTPTHHVFRCKLSSTINMIAFLFLISAAKQSSSPRDGPQARSQNRSCSYCFKELWPLRTRRRQIGEWTAGNRGLLRTLAMTVEAMGLVDSGIVARHVCGESRGEPEISASFRLPSFLACAPR